MCKWMSTKQAKMKNRTGSLYERREEGRDVVKDGEMHHLCNRPHAKIIQA